MSEDKPFSIDERLNKIEARLDALSKAFEGFCRAIIDGSERLERR